LKTLGSSPARINSSSENSVKDSTPVLMLRQNVSTSSAPGNRPDMPMIAIAGSAAELLAALGKYC